ncbi:hypothetical protein P3T76_012248 [Phytophthora citrophthora]|uniref:Uncharacterized protein n=1 Tax=Phytophthora citrophthora TaxID=4793 RepID=A0AAD9G5L1_9STRA|nr:hypothetical protein P3T76_012248 [Phytophthora citrophthora]
MVAELKDAATVEKPTEGVRENESASEFLERIELQHAKFYWTSRDGDGRLEEFSELMEARQDPLLGTSSLARGKVTSKTVVFIEVEN